MKYLEAATTLCSVCACTNFIFIRSTRRGTPGRCEHSEKRPRKSGSGGASFFPRPRSERHFYPPFPIPLIPYPPPPPLS